MVTPRIPYQRRRVCYCGGCFNGFRSPERLGLKPSVSCGQTRLTKYWQWNTRKRIDEFCLKKQKPSGVDAPEGISKRRFTIIVNNLKRKMVVIVRVQIGDYVVTIEIPIRP